MPPGQEGKITLEIKNTQSYIGETSKSATVRTNDPDRPVFTLILRARFKPEKRLTPPSSGPARPGGEVTPEGRRLGPFMISPNDRWIAGIINGNSARASIYLYNEDEKPVAIKKIEPGGEYFKVAMQPIQEGKRYEFQIVSDDKLKPGRYEQKVRVLTDNAKQPEFTLHLELTVLPNVFAVPNSLNLLRLSPGQDLSIIQLPVVQVRKLRGGKLKVNRVTSSLPFLKTELLPETDGQLYKIKLALDGAKLSPKGKFKGTVRIETDDPDIPVLEIPVEGVIE